MPPKEEGGGERGEDAGAPVAGLHVFQHKGGRRERLLTARGADGAAGERFRRAVDEIPDGNDRVGRAEAAGEIGGEAFCRFRIVLRRRIHEKHAVRGEHGAVEGGIHRGVDAAGHADDGAGCADGGEKMRDAVPERRKEQVSRKGRMGRFRREFFRGGIEEEDRPRFFIGRGFPGEGPVFFVGRRHTVEGVAVFPVILKAPVIDVEHGHAEAGRGGGEHAVAFFVLAEGEGRGGKIEKNIRSVRREEIHWADSVIFIPAVFTEKDARREDAAFHWEIEGAEEFGERQAFLRRRDGSGREVAPVVELAVIREERFHCVGLPAPAGREEAALRRGEGGVVLPDAAVILDALPVNSAAPPDDDEPPRRFGDAPVIGFAFPEKRRLIPQIADEVACEAHFREDEDIRAERAGRFDLFPEQGPVGADISGDDLRLGGDDSQHVHSFFPKAFSLF